MNMEQSEKLLAAYLMDELDAATRVELEAALSADAALRDRLGDMRMALKLVHQGLEEEDKPQLSEARRLALLAAVAQPAKQAQPKSTPAGPSEKTTVSWWRRQHKIHLFSKKNKSTAQRAKVRRGRPMLSALTAVAASIMLIVGVGAFLGLFSGLRECSPQMSDVGKGTIMYGGTESLGFSTQVPTPAQGRFYAEGASDEHREGRSGANEFSYGLDYRYDQLHGSARGGAGGGGSGERSSGDSQNGWLISDGATLAKTEFEATDRDGRRSTITAPKLALSNGQKGYVSTEGRKLNDSINTLDTFGLGVSKAARSQGGSEGGGGRVGDRVVSESGAIHKEEVAESIWAADVGTKGVKASELSGKPSVESFSKAGSGALTISGNTVAVPPASAPPVVVADRTPAGAAPHGQAQPGGTPARPADKSAQKNVPDSGTLALGGVERPIGERRLRSLEETTSEDQKLRSLDSRDKKLDMARANTRNELDSPIGMDTDKDRLEAYPNKTSEVDSGKEKSRLGASLDKEITAGKGKAADVICIRETEIPWEQELQYPKNWKEQNARTEKPSVAAGDKVVEGKNKYDEKGLALAGSNQNDLVSRTPDYTKPVIALDQKGQNKDVAKTSANHSAEGEAAMRRDGTGRFANSATPAPTTAAATAAGPSSDDIYGRGKTGSDDGKDAASKQGLPVASTFREVPVNPWVMADRDRFSTFASDVDTASYTLCRSYLRAGYLPPRGAVRMEEFVNAFDYNYPRQGRGVFNIFAEAAPSPFAEPGEGTVLLKVGVQGRVIGREGRKSAHLIFVVDTSGSMAKSDRLPLIQNAIKMLADALDPNDQITLITYNRQASLVLEAVPASRKEQIVAACDNMRAGGPTNLLAGLEAGYSLARREFVAGRINRVILCTDGAANIGQTDSQAILDGVAEYRKQGITLTVAGFGQGGYNDELLETLAKKGDGSYMFIDTIGQAKESLVEKMNAALQTIAFDSRIQVEFNPDRVRRYRLIGYEKRQIADEDFRNDAIDAAEVGSGQSATALYELELKAAGPQAPQDLLGTVFVRYRNAEGRQIEEISRRIEVRDVRPMSVQSNPRFYLAASAARFAEILRESSNVKNGNYQQVQRILQDVCKTLPLDNKASELLQLVQKAKDAPRAP